LGTAFSGEPPPDLLHEPGISRPSQEPEPRAQRVALKEGDGPIRILFSCRGIFGGVISFAGLPGRHLVPFSA
jgi:hypothetical protein